MTRRRSTRLSPDGQTRACTHTYAGQRTKTGSRPADEKRSRVYIGEGGNLRTRIGDYRSPSGLSTANRVHEAIVCHLHAGGTVTLEWATRATLAVAELPTLSLTMWRQTARRLAEDAALAMAYADSELYVLNVDQGPKPGDRVHLVERRPRP